jgi:fructoselysine/glucoselysine PTS system EIIA component
MRKFLIASHGTFASGIKSSLDIIIGPMENVFLIGAYTGENKSIEDDLAEVLKQVSKEDELIVFTDLMGGSVTNQVLQYALKENVYIVSGFNLPLLLDILLSDPETPVDEVIETGICNAKDQIVFVNKLIAKNKEEND